MTAPAATVAEYADPLLDMLADAEDPLAERPASESRQTVTVTLGQ